MRPINKMIPKSFRTIQSIHNVKPNEIKEHKTKTAQTIIFPYHRKHERKLCLDINNNTTKTEIHL
jgi:hypothetical protein